jgi:hypothetical protein
MVRGVYPNWLAGKAQVEGDGAEVFGVLVGVGVAEVGGVG